MLTWKVTTLQGGGVVCEGSHPTISVCPRMVPFNVSTLTRTLKRILLQMGMWGKEKDYAYSVGLDDWYYFPLGLQRAVK